jgi:hypothetical protein
MTEVCNAVGLTALQRHYLELLNLDASGQQRSGKARVASAAVVLGPQPHQLLPPGWPLPADKCEVWVLTSTSGKWQISTVKVGYERYWKICTLNMLCMLFVCCWPAAPDQLSTPDIRNSIFPQQ